MIFNGKLEFLKYKKFVLICIPNMYMYLKTSTQTIYSNSNIVHKFFFWVCNHLA